MTEKMTGRKGLNVALGIVLLVSLIFAQDVSASRLREFSQLQFGGDLTTNSTTLSIMTANISRMYFTADGLIGIGTITPSSALEVVGNISVPGTFFIDNESGRVGIGTSSPQTELEVAGTINASAIQIGQSAVQVEAAAFKIGNYSSEYATSGFDRENVSDYLGGADVNASLIRVGNLSSVFEAAFDLANYSSEYATSGWDKENYSAEYASSGWQKSNYSSEYATSGFDRENISDYLGGENISIFNLANYSAEYASSGWKVGNYSSEYASSGFDNENFSARLSAENTSLWNITQGNITPSDAGKNVSAGTLFVDIENERVGVGTSTPFEKLEVAGVTRTDGVLLDAVIRAPSSSTTPFYTFTADLDTGMGNLNNQNNLIFWTNDEIRLIINGTGNVGIGTMSPNERLTVTGNMSVSDTFFVDNESKRVGIGTTAPAYTLAVIGDVNASNYYINGSSIFEILDNGTINRSLDLSDYYTKTEADAADDSGGSLDTDTLNLVNTTMLDNSTIVRMNTTNVGNLNVTGNFSIGTSDLFVDDTSGRVGIGTTSPLETFDVAGNIATAEYFLLRSDQDTSIRLTSDNVDFYTGGTIGLTVQSDQDVIIPSGNVGIGTTAPGRKLEVAGSMNSTELNVSGTTNLAYDSGKVGIGTAEPSSTLEVEGNMTVTDTNSTVGNFSIIQYNSTCSGFRFGATGGLILSCE